MPHRRAVRIAGRRPFTYPRETRARLLWAPDGLPTKALAGRFCLHPDCGISRRAFEFTALDYRIFALTMLPDGNNGRGIVRTLRESSTGTATRSPRGGQ